MPRPSEDSLQAAQIIDHLLNFGDAQIAAHSQRFFKTSPGEYGAGDRFLGIRVPRIRQAVRRYKSTSPNIAVELLQSPWHEIRLFALLLLVERFERYPEERKYIYQAYLDNTGQINNWDLVDSSAPKIVGAWLLERDRHVLQKLAKSSSLWERRIAIIACFHFIRDNQFDDALELSETLLADPEDLIHKAVGWMLREIGKRDLETELAFLNTHYRQMPRTMLRYSIEKLEPTLRSAYMGGKIV